MLNIFTLQHLQGQSNSATSKINPLFTKDQSAIVYIMFVTFADELFSFWFVLWSYFQFKPLVKPWTGLFHRV